MNRSKLTKLGRATAVSSASAAMAVTHTATVSSVTPIALYICWFVVELAFEVQPPPGEAGKDRGTRQAILGARDGALVASVWFASTRAAPATAALWVALAAFIFSIGLTVRIVAIRHLAENFTMVLTTKSTDGFRLITDGIYSRVRHPGYLGLIAIFVSWPLAAGIPELAAVVLVATFVVLWLRVRLEERDLEERFGRLYASYRDSVPAFLPSFFPVRGGSVR